MSDTSKIDINYVAQLARIELSKDEKEHYSSQLEQILEYCEKINKVDVSTVEPMAHAFPLYNVLQEDEEGPCFTPKEALMNAPAQRNNQVIVPKVVDDA